MIVMWRCQLVTSYVIYQIRSFLFLTSSLLDFPDMEVGLGLGVGFTPVFKKINCFLTVFVELLCLGLISRYLLSTTLFCGRSICQAVSPYSLLHNYVYLTHTIRRAYTQRGTRPNKRVSNDALLWGFEIITRGLPLILWWVWSWRQQNG